MLLNNYWHFKNFIDVYNMYYASPEAVSTIPNVKTTTNANAQVRRGIPSSSSYMNGFSDYSMKTNLTCTITSDTNPIDPTYYEAPNRLDSDNTKVSLYTVTYNSNVRNNNKNVTTFTIQGVNVSSSSFTITQIGIYKNLKYQDGKKILLALEELPDPITVPAGEGFTIIYEWTEQ